MKKIILFLLFLIPVLLFLITSCTMNGINLQLVGTWELDDLWLEDGEGYFTEASRYSGQLIINSDDTYYIDIRFKKPLNSTNKFYKAPFYCTTTDEVYIHVKEHGIVSYQNGFTFLNRQMAKDGEHIMETGYREYSCHFQVMVKIPEVPSFIFVKHFNCDKN